MPTTSNQGLPYPATSAPPAVPADILAAETAIEKKLVQVFSSSADRSAKVAAPTEGMVSYLQDTNKWNGYISSWSNEFAMVDSGAWTSYVPVWTATAGTPAVGSTGSLTGAYKTINGVTFFQVSIQTGGTGVSFGTGGAQWRVTIPVTAIVSLATDQVVGNYTLVDASASTRYKGQLILVDSAKFFLAAGDSPVTSVSQGAPITFAAGDSVTMTGFYRTTS